LNPPPITLKLDAPTRDYQPGQPLAGQFYGEGGQATSMRAVELSVLWYTAGQGDEDFAVHHFQRFVDEPARRLDLRRPQRFATVLPPSPLSYDGRIVKVCWCVRARLFPQQGPEAVVEVPFRLGSVPSVGADER
jgi:hypothetical protein